MRKTNLLYVITKLELGGAQKQLYSLIVGLDRQKFQFFLFTAQEGLLLDDFSSIEGLVIKRSEYLERPINPFKDFLAILELCRFIKANRIDILHTHSSKAGIIGRLAGWLTKTKLIIHSVHGWSFHDFQPWPKRKFFIFLEGICAKFTHKLIVFSSYDKAKGLSCNIGSSGKYRLIRYGIDKKDFSVDRNYSLRKEFGISDAELTVGMVACFKPQKSPLDFIKIASLIHQKIPGVRFFLVGDGVLRKKIEKLIERNNLGNIAILTGWRSGIPEILANFDIFVLTSLWEGLPIAVLESMASSLPVIATDTGGVSEVITQGKNGFLFKPHDTEGISQQLLILLKDAELRKRIGTNARLQLGNDFSVQAMLQSIQDLYSF